MRLLKLNTRTAGWRGGVAWIALVVLALAAAVGELVIAAHTGGSSNSEASAADAIQTTRLNAGDLRVEKLSEQMTLHTYHSDGLPGGAGAVSTFIFESADELLIFDIQFYRAGAEEAYHYIKSLNKPIDKIIITHGHGDHYWGIAYMPGLGPLWATAEVIKEAETLSPQWAEDLLVYGEPMLQIMPLKNLPTISETMPLGGYKFGGITFDLFQLPTHEVEHQTFVAIPEYGFLMVSDSIMPDGHQYIIPSENQQQIAEQVAIGHKTFEYLESLSGVDRLLFGHGVNPGDPQKYFAEARASLDLYLETSKQATSAEEFIRLAKAAQPQWHTTYLDIVVAELFPAQQ